MLEARVRGKTSLRPRLQQRMEDQPLTGPNSHGSRNLYSVQAFCFFGARRGFCVSLGGLGMV